MSLIWEEYGTESRIYTRFDARLTTWTGHSFYLTIKPQCHGIIRDRIIKHLHYNKGKKNRCTLLWEQDITHHIKPRLKLQTLLSPGGQVKRWGRHLMWAQTFIYYLLLQSKDKGNEDDCPVTEKTDEPDKPDWTVHLPQPGPDTTHWNVSYIFWSIVLEYL